MYRTVSTFGMFDDFDSYEELDLETMVTVPGQSYSVKELHDRFVKGLPLPQLKSYEDYDDDEGDDDLEVNPLEKAIDLTDYDDVKRDMEKLTKKLKENEIQTEKIRKLQEKKKIEEDIRKDILSKKDDATINDATSNIN